MTNPEKEPLLGNSQKRTTKNEVTVFAVLVFFLLCFVLGNGCLSQFVYELVSTDPKYECEAAMLNHTMGDPTSAQKSCTNGSRSTENFYQQTASQWMVYFNLAEKGLSFPLMIFCGVYSDVINRRRFLYIPLIGFFLKYAIIAVMLQFRLDITYLFIAYFTAGVTGSSPLLFLLLMACLGDVTSTNHRTMAFVILECIFGITIVIVFLSQGYVIQYLGFTTLFACCAAICLLTTIITCAVFPDTGHNLHPDQNVKISCSHVVTEIFSIYKSSSKNTDSPISSVIYPILAFTIIYVSDNPKTDLEVSYELGHPFCWSAVHIGHYRAAKDFGQYFLGVLSVKFLQNHVSDVFIVNLGVISLVAFDVLLYLAPSDLFIYMAATSGILSVIPVATLRGLLSKTVVSSKQGALFTNLFILETIAATGAYTVFYEIYSITQPVSRGLVFVILAALAALSVPVMCMTLKKPSSQEINIQQQSAKNA